MQNLFLKLNIPFLRVSQLQFLLPLQIFEFWMLQSCWVELGSHSYFWYLQSISLGCAIKVPRCWELILQVVIAKLRETNCFAQISYRNHLWWLWLHEFVLVWCLDYLFMMNWGFWVWDFGLYMWKQIGNLMFSPKQVALAWAKTPKTHPCSYTNCRLGELIFLEWETLSSKRNSLNWARIRSDFFIAHYLEPRSGEKDPLKREPLQLKFVFLCFKWIKLYLNEIMWNLFILCLDGYGW